MNNELVIKEVEFLNTNLLAIQQKETSRIYTAINFILRGLGLDERQIEYQRNKWLSDKVISKGVQKFSYPSKSGGTQETYCISLNKLPLALAKINITPKMQKDMPQLTEKLEAYQDKCADILADAFLPETSIHNQSQSKVPFTEIVQSIDIVANSLKVNDASKILMYDKLYNSYGVSTEFLPKYENNGSRELKSATELLKRINSNIKTAIFNQLLIKHGYLEERTRKSTKSDEPRYFKALTEKGLQYGENLISPRNQREVQPCYYADTFQELYNLVNEKAGVLA